MGGQTEKPKKVRVAPPTKQVIETSAYDPKGSMSTKYENQSEYYSTSIHNHTSLCGTTARAASPTRISREDTAKELQDHAATTQDPLQDHAAKTQDTFAAKTQDTLVDAVENAEVAEITQAKQDILNDMYDAFTSNLESKYVDKRVPEGSSSCDARGMKDWQKLKMPCACHPALPVATGTRVSMGMKTKMRMTR